MGGTEASAIVRLNVSDAPGALRLSTEAQWNQNEADWLLFLEKGLVFGVREENDLIATAAILPYGGSDAWISMVLVTAARRRRGVAKRLIDRCLATSVELNCTAWLDATPAGVAVYDPLGFMPVLELRRLRFYPTETRNMARRLTCCELDDFLGRDRQAMGMDRRVLLNELAGRPGSKLVSVGGAAALVRDGRTARHVGPLFAAEEESALALVHQIVRNETGPFLIDVIASQEFFLNGLLDSGWTMERPFQRMCFRKPPGPRAEPPIAVAGPEYG